LSKILLIFRSSVTVYHFVIVHRISLACRRLSRAAYSSYEIWPKFFYMLYR